MCKVGGALLGLLLLSGCGVVTAATPPPVEPAVIETETTIKPLAPVLRVYGVRHEALVEGIAYWNEVAGRTVMQHAGLRAKHIADATTVVVMVSDPGEGYEGLASGHVGHTAITIKIHERAKNNWRVFAHELGHALGLDDYNTGESFGIEDAGYSGIMSYEDIDNPIWADDIRLLNS